MKQQNNFASVDEVQVAILKELFSNGRYVETRGINTLEICHINFCITNPLNRITYNTNRKWKLPLAIGEFAWHISASNSVDFITYYARQWENFSNDGKTISQSCYGHKIFANDASGISQWNKLIFLLKKDKYSRRAVFDFYESESGIDYFAKDIACVCTIQFLIRDGKLDAVVNMRSNDLIWGLPYDIYFFTMLQELLALELKVELGCYYHNVGSMHIYDQHFELGKKMLEGIQGITIREMPKMTKPEQLKVFLEYERFVRTHSASLAEIDSLEIDAYWKTLLIHLLNYKHLKNKLA